MASLRSADDAAALTISLAAILPAISAFSTEQEARISALKGEVGLLTERVNVNQREFDDLKKSAETDQSEIRSLKEQLQFLTPGPTNSEGEPIDVVALEATVKGLSTLLEKEKASADWGLAWQFGHECTVKIVQDLSIHLSLSINEINQALRRAVHILDPQKAEIIFPDRQGEYSVNTGNLGGTHPLNQESLQTLSASQHTEHAETLNNTLNGPSILYERPVIPVFKTSETSLLSPNALPFTSDKTPSVTSQDDQPGTMWMAQARSAGIRVGTGPSLATPPTKTTSTRRLTAWDAKIGAVVDVLRNGAGGHVDQNGMSWIAPDAQVEATKPLMNSALAGEQDYDNATPNNALGKVSTAWDHTLEESKQALRKFQDTIPKPNVDQCKRKTQPIATNKKEGEPVTSTQTTAEDPKSPIIKDEEENRQMLETVSSWIADIATFTDPNSPVIKCEKEDQKTTQSIHQVLEATSSLAGDIQPFNDPKQSVVTYGKENQAPTDTQTIANYPKPPIGRKGAKSQSSTDAKTTVSLITPVDLSLVLEPFPIFNPVATGTRFAGTIPIRRYDPPFENTTSLIDWPSSVKEVESAASEGPKPTINQDIPPVGADIYDLKAAVNRFSQQVKYMRKSEMKEHDGGDSFFGTNIRPHTPPNGTRVLGSLLTPSVKREVLKDPFADYNKPQSSNSFALRSFVEVANATKWDDHGMVWQRHITNDGQVVWRLGVKAAPQFHHEGDLLAL